MDPWDCGSGAVISGNYRYLLWRIWGIGPRMLWVMLNPSVANADQDDPTLRRCIDFSKRWGFGGLEVVNLFAFISSDPKAMFKNSGLIGGDNDRYVEDAAKRAPIMIVAWGEQGNYQGRDRVVLTMLRRYATEPLLCLGTVQNGSPCHPARKLRTTILQPYDN